MSKSSEQKLFIPEAAPIRIVSQDVRQQYQEQYNKKEQRDLEVTFRCKDGVQMSDRQTLGLSDFLYKKVNQMGPCITDKVEFNYTDYRHEVVKYFLDCMHEIKPDPTGITTILEVLDLTYWEGKTTVDSFERHLSGRLMKTILEAQFPTGTKLLIAAFLSKLDNMSEEYQRKLARDLTPEFYKSLFSDSYFDMTSDPNKQLIQICIDKGIFKDNTHQSVVYTLAMFARDVERIWSTPSTLFYCFRHKKHKK